MKRPYRCESCKELFPYDERGEITRKLYNIVTISEDACPKCGSRLISSYDFRGIPENKYLSHYNLLNDRRYYAK